MRKGFSLTEVLLTMTIVGVVMALSLPAIVSNYQQNEYKTGLKKALSSLNNSISMNVTKDNESPYQNKNLFKYLQKNMRVVKTYDSEKREECHSGSSDNCSYSKTYVQNAAFYTYDGLRFEFAGDENSKKMDFRMHEDANIKLCTNTAPQNNYNMKNEFVNISDSGVCGGCGSYGLKLNPNNTKKPPCVITVDVNGDRNPNNYFSEEKYYASNGGKTFSDMFSVMITDHMAVPYGVAAQRAAYGKLKENE